MPDGIIDGRGRGFTLKVNEDGSIDVNIQDQHTEIIDLHLSREIQLIDIAVDTAINDRVVTVTTPAEPTDGNIVCFKEGTSFYQGLIQSHVANGADWDITLDTPLDFAFTSSGGCTERSTKLNVDGSITPVEFKLGPGLLEAGTEWDIVRVMFQIIDDVSMDDAKFGGITALTNGIVLRVEDGITKNIFNAKSNGDLAIHMYDVVYSDRAPAGLFGLRCRRTFGGQSKNGVTVRLVADDADALVLIVQDDLTDLASFEVVAQGHIVEN